jgi:hypothetical protein
LKIEAEKSEESEREPLKVKEKAEGEPLEQIEGREEKEKKKSQSNLINQSNQWLDPFILILSTQLFNLIYIIKLNAENIYVGKHGDLLQQLHLLQLT